MKNIKIPSIEEVKRSAIEHILYEIEMLFFIKNRFIEAKKLGKGWVDESILIECFLLHYRNLSDFFLKDRGVYYKSKNERTKNDDVVCGDFNFPKNHELLIGNILDINKRLSHLTYSRLESNIVWEICALGDEISRLIKEFIEHLIIHKYIVENDINYQRAINIRNLE